MTEYSLCIIDEESGEWAALDTRMVEARKAALATLPEIERLQHSIEDLYNFVGRDFAHLEPKQALEAHMAAVVKDAVADYKLMHAEMTEDLNTHRAECVALHKRIAELEQRGEPVAWIEHHKAGDNLNWERVDHSYAQATPLYLAAPSPEEK